MTAWSDRSDGVRPGLANRRAEDVGGFGVNAESQFDACQPMLSADFGYLNNVSKSFCLVGILSPTVAVEILACIFAPEQSLDGLFSDIFRSTCHKKNKKSFAARFLPKYTIIQFHQTASGIHKDS